MLKPDIAQRINAFTEGADAETLMETVDALLGVMTGALPPETLDDAFYQELDFGTGGLRGIMGPGTNRMNRVTVGKATQGLASYVRKHAGESGAICIAYDSRLRSKEFAFEAAMVIAGNGLRAYLFEELRPTPELSFAVRHTGANAGIVITASHNPKEYSGYKVSWADGGQVVPPHDKAIIEEVRAVTSGIQIKRAKFDEAVAAGQIVLMGKAVDEAYLQALGEVRIRPELTASQGKEIRIAYTPLHGTGITVVPDALSRWGFTNISIVPEQETPDGNFPTTKSPNPEEKAALQLVIALAQKMNADVVFATDPDADRIGVAVLHKGEYQLLNGNQVGALVAYYVCESLREKGALPANGVLIKTIVTTELITSIAREFNVGIENTLTGFKYIANLIRKYELEGSPGQPTNTFLMGCEESYGYLVGTHARDKDAVVTSCVLAEMALWAKTNGKTLIDVLYELFARHGVFIESQLSKTMPGKAGMEQIGSLMQSLREDPPKEIGGMAVAYVTDIKTDTRIEMGTGNRSSGPGLPPSNVVIFELVDGSLVIARPSGTEPKIKFYFMVVDNNDLPLDVNEMTTKIAACQKKEQLLLKTFDEEVSGRIK